MQDKKAEERRHRYGLGVCAKDCEYAVESVQAGAERCAYGCFEDLIVGVVGAMQFADVVIVHHKGMVGNFLGESSERCGSVVAFADCLTNVRRERSRSGDDGVSKTLHLVGVRIVQVSDCAIRMRRNVIRPRGPETTQPSISKQAEQSCRSQKQIFRRNFEAK